MLLKKLGVMTASVSRVLLTKRGVQSTLFRQLGSAPARKSASTMSATLQWERFTEAAGNGGLQAEVSKNNFREVLQWSPRIQRLWP